MKNKAFFSLMLLFVSCNFFKAREHEEKVLARAYDKTLTIEEVAEIIPKNTSKTDSLDILNRYINSWVSKQLMLRNAEANLDYNEVEVERKILDYRYALLVYEYEKQYLSQHLDTVITSEEIEAYYKKNIDNFELKQNIIKGMFVKTPLQAPKLSKLKSLMQAKKKDYKAIRSFCYRFANNYVLADTMWNGFEEMMVNTPYSNIPDKVQFLKKTKFAETTDSTHAYFLSINDYKIVDQSSPFEFAKDQIVNIILNKRKLELVKKLEKEIYKKAQKNKDFEIYIENN